MAVLIRPKRWGLQKPPVSAQLDRGHPLAQGLRACLLLRDGGGKVVQDACAGSSQNVWLWFESAAGDIAWTRTFAGPGLAFVGGSGAAIYNDTFQMPTAAMTVAILVRVRDTSQQGLAFTARGNPGGTNTCHLYCTFSDATLYWDFGGASGNNRVNWTVPAGWQGGWHWVVATGGPHGMGLFNDGVLVASGATAVSRTNSGNGFEWGSTTTTYADYAAWILWDRQFLPGEVAAFQSEPYAMILPPIPAQRWFMAAPSAPTGAFRNAVVRLRLRVAAVRDAVVRFRLRVAAFRDIGLRYRLRVQSFGDATARLRLRATAFKDAAVRFNLATADEPWPLGLTEDIAAAFKDTVLRLRLRVQSFRDATARFRLQAAAFKDSAVRLRLRATAYRDAAVRFNLLVSGAAIRDAGLRLRLRATTFRDARVRFGLGLQAYRDAGSRFRLRAAAFRDSITRYRLQVQRYRDAGARLRLQVQRYADSTFRLRLRAQAFRDAALRFNLLVSGQAYRDAALRLRLRATALRDAATRLRLQVGAFKDAAIRFRLAPLAFKDATARYRVRAGANLDARTRYRLQVQRFLDGSVRYRLRATGYRQANVRFNLAALVGQSTAARAAPTDRDHTTALPGDRPQAVVTLGDRSY